MNFSSMHIMPSFSPRRGSFNISISDLTRQRREGETVYLEVDRKQVMATCCWPQVTSLSLEISLREKG